MQGKRVKIDGQEGEVMDKIRVENKDQYLIRLDNNRLVTVDVDKIELSESQGKQVLHG